VEWSVRNYVQNTFCKKHYCALQVSCVSSSHCLCALAHVNSLEGTLRQRGCVSSEFDIVLLHSLASTTVMDLIGGIWPRNLLINNLHNCIVDSKFQLVLGCWLMLVFYPSKHIPFYPSISLSILSYSSIHLPTHPSIHPSGPRGLMAMATNGNWLTE